MWCEHKISFANKGKKHLMRHCVTDEYLERLKVRVVTVGVDGPLNQHQKAEKQQIIRLNIIAFLEIKCQAM